MIRFEIFIVLFFKSEYHNHLFYEDRNCKNKGPTENLSRNARRSSFKEESGGLSFIESQIAIGVADALGKMWLVPDSPSVADWKWGEHGLISTTFFDGDL